MFQKLLQKKFSDRIDEIIFLMCHVFTGFDATAAGLKILYEKNLITTNEYIEMTEDARNLLRERLVVIRERCEPLVESDLFVENKKEQLTKNQDKVMETEIYKNTNGRVLYFKDVSMIAFEWEGYPNNERLKNMLMQALQFSKENAVYKELHDMTKVKGTFTTIVAWVLSEYEPEMTKLGRIKLAVVPPEDTFTKYAISTLFKLIGSNDLRTFKTIELAKNWLIQSR